MDILNLRKFNIHQKNMFANVFLEGHASNQSEYFRLLHQSQYKKVKGN